MASDMKTVGVVGLGVIGASWTALFLAQGLQVLVSDPAPDAEKTLEAHLEHFWPALKELGLASGASLKNYKFVGSSLKGHYDKVDFIQENAPERLELKTKLIAEIDAGARKDVVIASSSSGISSSKFIGDCKNAPERVLIGHPFNPPHLMPLVEVVPHPKTSDAAKQSALKFYKGVGKAPILVKKETPGHVANRLQAAVCQEAYSLISRGIVTSTDLDACMTTSLGPRYALIGPIMANILGGGGGAGGFKHMMHHLGPAMQAWLADMKANEIVWDEATLDAIDKSVQEQLGQVDIAKVEEQRDELTISLLKDKKGASELV